MIVKLRKSLRLNASASVCVQHLSSSRTTISVIMYILYDFFLSRLILCFVVIPESVTVNSAEWQREKKNEERASEREREKPNVFENNE